MTEETAEKRYLTSIEACRYLNIKDVNTLYWYIKEGKLKAYKLGKNGENSRRHWRLTTEDLDAFIKADYLKDKTIAKE